MQKTRKATAQSAKANKQSNQNEDEDFNQDEADLAVRAKRMNISQVNVIHTTHPIQHTNQIFDRSKKRSSVIRLKPCVLTN